ncbi:MAG: hypothetical protein EA353_14295 [Puniceicoccaceae bacterium]|nr:MAG: hypothetical protein EA353_14295 [Puniceicoccaceae bacterium]
MSPKAKDPVICFGQQPCGFLPRRFLWAKIQTARRIQQEIGGRIVFFFHDSDHDPRETQTMLQETDSGNEQRINFRFANKVQKKYSPLYAKRIAPDWTQNTLRQLPKFMSRETVEVFSAIETDNVADYCLEAYRKLGLLDGIAVVRSSDPELRKTACEVEDFYVDTHYEGETVRARWDPEKGLRLHSGGSAFIDLPARDWGKHQISPSRDTRLPWMQSIVCCTHYIAGEGELKYLKMDTTPEIKFIQRDAIENASAAYLP